MNSGISKKKLIVIAGPTAVGKTALSIKLAKALSAEIISADSRQFYKEISIGTAKPSPEELKEVKHHYIDNVSISEHYSAGMFEKDVIAFLDNYFKTKDIAIMCGGSGMYIDAVCNGMDEFEPIDPAIREQLNEEIKQNGLAWLQEQVATCDPDYYAIVDKQNPARLQRALEVFRNTGAPYSKNRKGQTKSRNFSVIKLMLNMDREALYNRINARTDEMMRMGFLEEAKSVLPYRKMNALNTVGYKELFDHLDGKCDLERAVELIKQNTRRYAKRQLTWFNNSGGYRIFEQNDLDKIIQFIINWEA